MMNIWIEVPIMIGKQNLYRFFSLSRFCWMAFKSTSIFFRKIGKKCRMYVLFLHFVSLSPAMWNEKLRWKKLYKNWLIEGWRGSEWSLAAAAASTATAAVTFAPYLCIARHNPHIHMPLCTYEMYIWNACDCALKCVSGKFRLLNRLDLTAFMNIIITVCSHACQPQYRKRSSQSNCAWWTITHASLSLLLLTVTHWSLYIVCAFLFRLIYVVWVIQRFK